MRNTERLPGARDVAEDLSESFQPNPKSAVLDRVFNVSAASALLLVAAPVMAVTALLVRLTSRGPIFYTQTRVGIDRRWDRTHALRERRREDLGGVPFTIYKFRSMRVNAEQNGQAQWARLNDDRVTPIGQFLRRTRLDELPQLLNVLLGDMNIVGPRPEQPEIFQNLRVEVPSYAARQRVRPGITGRAQITLAYDSNIDDVRKKVAADLEYIESQSLLEDLHHLGRAREVAPRVGLELRIDIVPNGQVSVAVLDDAVVRDR